MALTGFLYRCPLCGADPLVGSGTVARCASGCGRVYRPDPRRGVLTVLGGEVGEITFPEARRLIAQAEVADRDRGRGATREAEARMRLSEAEPPVRYRGGVLGFYERFGPAARGRLRLEDAVLSFTPAESAEEERRWGLEDVTALQTSSASIQVALRDRAVVLFRFPSDSSRRWEDLLTTEIAHLWRERGWGEIAEYQPRIRGR